MEADKGIKKLNKKIIALAIVFTAVAAVFVHAGFVLSKDVIHDGVYASEVNLGGMTKEKAKKVLEGHFKTQSDIVLSFKCEEINFKINPESIGFKNDIEKAIKTAYNAGRSGNVFQNYMDIMAYKISSYSFPVEFSYDTDRLLLLVNDNVQEKIVDPIDMSVEIGEECLYVTNSVSGKGIDEKKLFKDVDNRFEKFSDDDVIDVSIITKKAKDYDYKEFYEKYNREAKDAIYTKTEESFIIEPEVVGIELDKDETKKILEENKENEETYEIPAKITRPEVTAKMLEDKYVNKIMASYSTSLGGSSANRIANVALAASKINGYVINPGKRFSYNKVVGPRTAATGFKTAHVYVGTEVVDGIGGGICQVSSTLYNSVVMADLKIVSRTNHSMPVGYVPLGRDATVSYGSIDFVFENNKPYPVSIKAGVSGMTLTVSIVGTSDMDYTVEFVSETVSTIPYTTKITEDPTLKEGETKKVSSGANGYVANSYRVYKKDGKQYERKYEAKSRYTPTPEKVVVGTMPEEKPPEELPVEQPPEAMQPPEAEVEEPTLNFDEESEETSQNVNETIDNEITQEEMN